MIDTIFVNQKIDFIKRDLFRLKDFGNLTFEKAARDWKSYCIIKNILMEVIGRGIDINQHLIAELAGPEIVAPLDYTQTFLKLGELKILPEKFANQISKSAGFRNAIVHGYNDLDQKTVYRSVGDALKEYVQYCDYILKFLSKTASKV